MRSAGRASGGAGAATGGPASGRRLRLRLPTAPAVRGGAQRAGRRLGVVGVGQRAHDDDPPRSRLDHRADGAGVEAADGEPRDRHVGGGVRDRPDADRRPSLLGRRRVDGADGDVVRAAATAGLGLLHRVRREPDERVLADELARAVDRHVVLADVHAVRAAGGREVGAVVEQEERAGGLAQRARGRGGVQQLVVGGVLVAQLEEVDAAGQRALEGALHPAAVGDEVQAGIAQACSTVHAHSLASPRATIGGQREPSFVGLRGRHHGRRPSGADPGHAGEARGRDIPQDSDYDVAIVGGGIVGLAIAWRARQRGLTVLLLERSELGAGTSRVAAGMLAPVAETDAGERALLELGLRSAAGWAEFAAQLAEVSGIDVGYRPCGTLMLARDRDEAEALERARDLRERFELNVEALLPSAARRLEPALAPTVRSALHLPDDHSADPRRVCAALARAADRAGAVLRTGVAVADLGALPAEQVVVAAGPWSGALGDEARVRPVKGQSLRLRDPAGPGLLERVVRWGQPSPGYLVPRGDGRYVLGATQEERGFDTAVTALGVHDLLRDAAELVPGVLELEIEEAIAGLRPGTPDNAPIIGRSPSNPRVVWATGHYRNGVLLAPVTADLVVAELAGEPIDHAFGPERFAAAPAEALS